MAVDTRHAGLRRECTSAALWKALSHPPPHHPATPPAPWCSAPTAATVEAGKTTTSTASISVVAPSLAPSGGWSKYTLLACPTKPLGTCLPAQDCTPVRAPPAATVCTVKGLAQDTTYSVRARAEKDSVRSSYSSSQSFTTLA